MSEEDSHAVVRALDPAPPRRRRTALNADITPLLRALLGLATGLLGAIMAISLIVAPQAEFQSKGLLETAAGLYFGAWVAAGLLAFTGAQAIQLFFVGGDQGDDQRAWERMTPAERRAWQLRESAAGPMAIRLMVLLGCVLTLLVDWRLARVNGWRSEGAGFALLVVLAVHLVTGWFAVLSWRSWRRRAAAAHAIPVAAATASQGRWSVEIRHDPRVAPALTLFCALGTAVQMAIEMTDRAPRQDQNTLLFLGAMSAAVALAAGWRLLRVRNQPRPLKRRLEVIRKTDVPLVLECTADLQRPLQEVVALPWLARLAAYYSYSTVRTDDRYDRWLDLAATVLWVNRHAGTVHFRFEVPPIQDLPARPLHWKIQLENPPGLKPAAVFDLPRDVVFTEEF